MSTVPSIGAGNHLVESPAERLDQMRLVGVPGKQLGDRFGERAACILPLVPFLGADVGEERFHCRSSPAKSLRYRWRGFQLQQHAAEIEDDDAAACRTGAPAPHAATHARARLVGEHATQQRDRFLDALDGAHRRIFVLDADSTPS